jgi:16S rRNA processing protein RimM
MTSSSPSEKPDPSGRGRAGEAPSAAEELIVGRLVGVFGRIGEVKLLPLTDFPERIGNYESLLLRFPGGREEQRRVERARPHKGVLLLKLAGCDSIDAAEMLIGAEAWIRPEQAGPLPEGHFYVHDLIGLDVVTLDGEALGAISEVLRGPANDVYVAGKYLIPATHDAVAEIDMASRRLVVRSRQFLEPEEA